MKRKTSSVPSRVWTYGCLRPTKEVDNILRQIRLSNTYYNKLIEIERERRQKYREARSETGAVLRELEGQRDAITKLIDEHRDKIKSKRSAERKRGVVDPDMRAIIKIQIERRGAVVARIREERDRLKSDARLMLASDQINARALERVKEERSKCGLYWGTYLLVERAVEAARKSKQDPRFHRFDGEGRVGVQIQGGMAGVELFSQRDTRLQLTPLPSDQWDTRSGRRHAYTTVRLRVGSNGRAPVWAELPAVLHRPLPADGRVMWAWIKVYRIGPRTKYQFQVTMESESFRRDPELIGSERVAAMDIGWRALPSGDVRVGYLFDYLGRLREFVLPKAIRESLAYCDKLRSYNDDHFNDAKSALKAWLAEHARLAPEWLPAEVETMPQWRSRSRLSRLALKWSDEYRAYVEKAWREWKNTRLPAGKDLFASASEIYEFVGADPVQRIVCYLAFWARKEMHLWTWEENQRQRARLRRKDIYRNWAAELRREYAYVAIESFDLTTFAAKSTTESEEVTVSEQRRMLSDVAPNEFRLALESALGKACLPRVDPMNTTRLHDCGHTNTSELFKLDVAKDIVVTCESCGKEFDQDEQAARNIFVAFEKSRSGDPEPGPESPKPVARKRKIASAAQSVSPAAAAE